MEREKPGKISLNSPGMLQEKTGAGKIQEALENADPIELQSDRKRKSGARPSEIRRYLLRYAARRGIIVKEHLSEPMGKTAWFTHVQILDQEGAIQRSATAVSYECSDNGLVMAMLSLFNPEITFLD